MYIYIFAPSPRRTCQEEYKEYQILYITSFSNIKESTSRNIRAGDARAGGCAARWRPRRWRTICGYIHIYIYIYVYHNKAMYIYIYTRNICIIYVYYVALADDLRGAARVLTVYYHLLLHCILLTQRHRCWRPRCWRTICGAWRIRARRRSKQFISLPRGDKNARLQILTSNEHHWPLGWKLIIHTHLSLY